MRIGRIGKYFFSNEDSEEEHGSDREILQTSMKS